MLRSIACVSAACALVSCTATTKPTSLPADVFGHCVYENPFAHHTECQEFHGAAWTTEDAAAACAQYDAKLEKGACGYDATMGTCITAGKRAGEVVADIVPAGDPNKCADNERGCTLFAGGTWQKGTVCGGASAPDPDDAYDPDHYFIQATRVCEPPKDGEPPGHGDDAGDVCTWQAISGCTEEGRHFEDYGSCDIVFTQRPYAPVAPDTTFAVDDPRLHDATYAANVAWVKQELESCACVCCHAQHLAPSGASVWDLDVDGNFANTFTPWGLAFAARAFDSSLLGEYPASDNNGFSRHVAGLPSTDEARMKQFFVDELTHRGYTVADFADQGPAPAVFAAQASYVPSACSNGEGVDVDGVVHWQGGRARYLYVLEAGSANPGVPPNLDKPAGTLWRSDTVPPAVPQKTGEVTYGVVPAGHVQSVPDDGTPPAPLVSGHTYYLYVLADVGVPITRCLFDAP